MEETRVVAIIQARMGGTRLPGKVLLDLAGELMLVRDMNRLSHAGTLDKVVVATTVKSADDAIVSLCDKRNWLYFRGSEEDVLDRYYCAAKEYQPDVVVRITADCPLIDAEIVDRVVREFLDLQPEVDYASNIFPRRTFPRGLDTEVMRFDVLERAWHDDLNPTWREHVTTYIQRNPGLFCIHGITNEVDHSHMRWTVDTSEDLAFIRCIYDHFGHDHFSWRDIIAILEDHPEWLEINRQVQQKAI